MVGSGGKVVGSGFEVSDGSGGGGGNSQGWWRWLAMVEEVVGSEGNLLCVGRRQKCSWRRGCGGGVKKERDE